MELERKLKLLGDPNQLYIMDGQVEFIESAYRLLEIAVDAIKDSNNLSAIPYDYTLREGNVLI